MVNFEKILMQEKFGNFMA